MELLINYETLELWISYRHSDNLAFIVKLDITTYLGIESYLIGCSVNGLCGKLAAALSSSDTSEVNGRGFLP